MWSFAVSLLLVSYSQVSVACRTDVCKTVTCAPVEESSCNGVYSDIGGFCGCCPRCEPFKSTGQFCGNIPLARMQPKCAPGLVCRESDSTCQPTSKSRHGPVMDLRAGEYCGPLISVSQRSCAMGLQCVNNFCKPPPKGPGESCEDMMFEPKCVEGYKCVDNTCVSSKMTLFAIEGQTCNVQFMCEQGLSCLNGRCTSPHLNEGQLCDRSTSQRSRSCGAGLQCVRNICVRADQAPLFSNFPISTVVGAGQFCGFYATGAVNCRPGLQCIGNVCQAARTPEALLEEGQGGCQYDGRKCNGNLVCINNICSQRPTRTIGIGDYCGADFPTRICVVGTECRDGVCVANPNISPVDISRAGEGQYCVPNEGPLCRSEFTCVDNICRRKSLIPNELPESCSQRLHVLSMRNPPPEDMELPHCDSDGSWSPVQCGKMSCYCVDSGGTRLELYSVSRFGLNSAEEYMNCKCARDEAEYSKRGNNDRWLFKCDKMGNYAPMQCLHGSCFCGDHDGNPIQGYENMQSGTSNPANVDCGCARDKFNYEMYGTRGSSRMAEDVYKCDNRGRYKMKCDADFNGLVPFGNQAHVMCCCVDDRGAIRNQFGINQCFRRVDVENGDWCP